MLRVTVELIPFGDEDAKKTIKTMEIWNTGEGDQHRGIYLARLIEEDGTTIELVKYVTHWRCNDVLYLIEKCTKQFAIENRWGV